ncbi:hypothetical protein HOY82DRAFT_537035 [Tuber indicum]|nr:hypothetical protein HOY82DRAFT_537035 [Tuber indicum]
MMHHFWSFAPLAALLRRFHPHAHTLHNPNQMRGMAIPSSSKARRERTRPKPDHKRTRVPNSSWIKEYKEISKKLLEAEQDKMKLTLDLTNEKGKRQRLKENFNIRGALATERLVSQIPLSHNSTRPVGIQRGINELAQLPLFQTTLCEEVKSRALKRENVESCVHHIYRMLSKYAHGNNGTVITRHEDHPANEVEALVAIFKAQGKDANAIAWREVPPLENSQ